MKFSLGVIFSIVVFYFFQFIFSLFLPNDNKYKKENSDICLVLSLIFFIVWFSVKTKIQIVF